MRGRVETAALFDLSHTLCGAFLAECRYPWQALPHIGDWIEVLGKGLSPKDYEQCAPSVWIARSARVASAVCISGPCIIGAETEVRHGAFLRGNTLVGAKCVVGNSTELKNAVLFDDVQVPHFNYVGDSILGHRAHFGAGVVTSNVKCDKSLVCIRLGGESLPTGRKKVGAMVGDGAEVGCNSVLNPGTVLGRGSVIYPLSAVRGVVPAGMIYKGRDAICPRCN